MYKVWIQFLAFNLWVNMWQQQTAVFVTFSYGLLQPKPKMSKWPCESVQAKCCPSVENLQSKIAPWPCPSIWKKKINQCEWEEKNHTVEWFSLLISYHIEEVSDLGSFFQVPDVNVSIMASREHDTGVKRVSLQHKDLVIVTLKHKMGTKGQFVKKKIQKKNTSSSHSQTKCATAGQSSCSTLWAGSLTQLWWLCCLYGPRQPWSLPAWFYHHR